MTPAAKAALVSAHMLAQKLTPRINNGLLKAAQVHTEQPDTARLGYLRDAKAKAITVLQMIQTAEVALTMHRRKGGE